MSRLHGVSTCDARSREIWAAVAGSRIGRQAVARRDLVTYGGGAVVVIMHLMTEPVVDVAGRLCAEGRI